MELKYKQELESTRKWKRKKKKPKSGIRIAVVKVGPTKTKTKKRKKEGLGNGMYLAEKKSGGWVKGLVGIGLERRWWLNQWDGELECWKNGGMGRWVYIENESLESEWSYHNTSYTLNTLTRIEGELRTWRLLVSSWLWLIFYHNNPIATLFLFIKLQQLVYILN